MSETESASNSHASSFDESLSQSVTRQPPSAEATEQCKTIVPHGIATPPTTTSNPSSQESPAKALRGSPYVSPAVPPVKDSTTRVQSLSVDVNGANQPYLYPATLEHSGHIPNKRLANGEIKHGDKSLSSSPTNPGQYGHSRSTSVNSKDSPIREVSWFALASRKYLF
jgi:hypothetical protein